MGLRFEEVREQNLLKVSLDREALEGKEYCYNKTGYVIHGSIYRARAAQLDNSPAYCANSGGIVLKNLILLSQWALHFYEQVAYHDYNSLALDEKGQGQDLAKDLKAMKVMFLRNHGIITAGKTIYEAFFYCYHLELACRAQIAALSTDAELVMPSAKICAKSCHDLLNFEEDIGLRDWLAWERFIGGFVVK